MTNGILQNVLGTLGYVIISTTSITPPATPPQALPQFTKEVIHVVQNGETLSSIAEKKYGSGEYWTTILNDNPQLTDYNVVDSGAKLVLRTKKPLLVEDLKDFSKPVYATNKVNKEIATIYPKQYVQSAYTKHEPSVTPTVTVTPVPVQPAILASTASGPLNEAQITFLGNCESGMNPATNTGNGFYGAFQFMISTWNNMGTGYLRPDLAPLEVQKDAVQRLLTRSSIWTQFPGCANKMRSAGLI